MKRAISEPRPRFDTARSRRARARDIMGAQALAVAGAFFGTLYVLATLAEGQGTPLPLPSGPGGAAPPIYVHPTPPATVEPSTPPHQAPPPAAAPSAPAAAPTEQSVTRLLKSPPLTTTFPELTKGIGDSRALLAQ